MKWVIINEADYTTYPDEGVDVIVSDGTHYDVAYYIKSSLYIWFKVDLIADDAVEFKSFNITKWSYIA